MALHIPKTFIADLINRIDIVDVIDNRITLKRAGSNYVACCPFHNEKSPSFTVSPSKQFYHCFGCGSHGSAISFIMEYDHLDYVEAIEVLATQLGISVPYENQRGAIKNNNKVSSDLYQYMLQAANFYQAELAKNSAAQDYLQQRGLDVTIIERFALGYAPAAWAALAEQFADNLHPTLELIGLLVKNKSQRFYDKFRERIMFPIRDQRGRIVGFGGRILQNKPDNDQPKYLNSPETPIFHKSSVVYGLYEALQTHRNLNKVILVEGYMDVIALAQYGITYAVAAMGTAATKQHLERLFRHSSLLIFCFDGDNAGKNAGKRALETVLPLMEEGRQVKFMFLPEEHDPDSFIRAYKMDGFLKAMDQAIGIGEFSFNVWQQDIDMTSIDGRAKFIKSATTFIEAIPAGTFREVMINELAKRARLGQENFTNLNKVATSMSHEINLMHRQQSEGRPSPMRLVIALLLQQPQLINVVPATWQVPLDNIPGGKILTRLIALLREQPSMSTGVILEYSRDAEEYTQMSKLAALTLTIPEEGYAAELIGALQQLIKLSINQQIETLMQKASIESLSLTEKQTLQELIKINQV